MLDNAMKGEIEMDNKRQAEEDYLYHCNGCNKADKNYPDKMTECEECEGSGIGLKVVMILKIKKKNMKKI